MTDQVFLELPAVTLDEAKLIQKAIATKPLISFSLCTTLPLALCQNLIHTAGMNQVCFVEDGLVQYYPGMRMDHDLFLLISPKQIEFYDEFIRWLRDYEGPIRRIKEYTCSFVIHTVDPQTTGEQLYSLLTPSLRKAVDTGLLVLHYAEEYVRLLPAIGKADAIRYMYEHYSRTKKGTLAIGFSAEDVLMMEECETCACTQDAQIVDYVRKRKGYVAKASGVAGIVEIIERLQA